jgi:hypothetical protein
VITDARRVCELLVGLPDVTVLGVEDRPGGPLAMFVEQAGDRPGCLGCEIRPVVNDRETVELVDLPSVDRPGCAGGKCAAAKAILSSGPAGC